MDLKRQIRLDPNDGEERALLGDIQANIVSPHGRDFANHIFLRFSAERPEDARAFIRAVRAIVTSAADHLAEAARYRLDSSEDNQHTCICLGLSAEGCRLLGIPDHLLPNDEAFLAGMSARAEACGDTPDSDGWPAHLKAPHAVVIVADDRTAALEDATTLVLRLLASQDRDRAVIEPGAWLHWNTPGSGRQRIEHFGFVDGLSNPDFFEAASSNATKLHWDSRSNIDAVLTPCKLNGDTCYGSLLVFRKLEQDVRAFWEAEAELEQDIKAHGGSSGRVAAMAMGRFRDGTPLVLRTAPSGMADADNFLPYRVLGQLKADARCPMHSHIRRANPRGELMVSYKSPTGGQTYARPGYKPITRRGIPFGSRTDDPTNPAEPLGRRPERGVGMLFMSVHSNIGEQFEYVNRVWLRGLRHNEILDPTTVDPVATNAPNGAQLWPVEWDNSALGTVQKQFRSCVTLRGGEYFFLPPKSWLRQI